MSNVSLSDLLQTAKAAEVATLEALGLAIAKGDEAQITKCRVDLADKARAVQDLERSVQAVGAASAAAERARIEKERQEAAAARARLIENARTDHADLTKKAAKVDKALAALGAALADLGESSSAFINSYGELGINSSAQSFLRARGWANEVMNTLKHRCDPSLTSWFAMHRVLTFGTGTTVAKLIPAFESVVILKLGDEADTFKDAA
jgi:hypothetical protein